MDIDLKSLASRLRGSVKVNSDRPQDYFNYIYPKIFTKNQEYFSNFSSEELLKVVLYVYSLKTTGDFKKAEDIFENLAFMIAFSTDDQVVSVDCNNCGGQGREDCDECSGSGNEECSDCDGSGNITCSECGGDGKSSDETDEEGNPEDCDFCDGEGQVECDNCGGDGRVDCRECDGTGGINCDYCDGEGEFEDEDLNFVYIYNIISWNPSLNDRAEIVEATKESLVPNLETLLEMDDVVVVQPTETREEEISEDYVDDEIYVYEYTDSPEIVPYNQHRTLNFRLKFPFQNFKNFIYM